MTAISPSPLFLLVEASSVAGEVDFFFWLMVALCGTVATGIAVFLIYSANRYHRKHDNEMGAQTRNYVPAEVTWIVIPFFLFMAMFAWGSKLYFDIERPPANAISMYAVGKQWMWKLQHPEGQREINELHIPVGRPVKLTLTSEDVIHSFFVPAFRTKQDVLPGRYTTTWFEAMQPGKYHLFCAEYCGTKHSGMIGWVYAMEPQDYQTWLSGGGTQGSLADAGEKLFQDLACINCHHLDGSGRCPTLAGLFGKTVQLSGGGTVKADEAYIRESILQPTAKVVAGYQPVMPTFQGLVAEEGILQLIEYIKSIGPKSPAPESG